MLLLYLINIDLYNILNEKIHLDPILTKEFMAFKEDVFDGMEIVPNPTTGTNVFVLGAGEEYGENIVYVIDCENDTEAYLYIYYNR